MRRDCLQHLNSFKNLKHFLHPASMFFNFIACGHLTTTPPLQPLYMPLPYYASHSHTIACLGAKNAPGTTGAGDTQLNARQTAYSPHVVVRFGSLSHVSQGRSTLRRASPFTPSGYRISLRRETHLSFECCMSSISTPISLEVPALMPQR